MSNEKRIQEILEKIKEIQTSDWNGVVHANMNVLHVKQLNKELDQLGYTGEKPPESWQQLPEKYYQNKNKKKS